MRRWLKPEGCLCPSRVARFSKGDSSRPAGSFRTQTPGLELVPSLRKKSLMSPSSTIGPLNRDVFVTGWAQTRKPATKHRSRRKVNVETEVQVDLAMRVGPF